MRPDVTLVLARIFGPSFVVAGVMLITQHARMRGMLGEFLGDDPLMAFAGFVMLMLGLLLVTIHQRWDGITASIITLVGWLSLIRGGVLLLAPSLVRDIAVYVIPQPYIMPVAGCVIALIGVWLSYTGFIAGVLRADTSR